MCGQDYFLLCILLSHRSLKTINNIFKPLTHIKRSKLSLVFIAHVMMMGVTD